MSDHTIELIAIIFGSNGLWVLLNNFYQNKKKKKTPIEKMVQALVRDKLLVLSKNYIKMGGIPEDELGSFNELYKSYIEDGGNSNVQELCKRAGALPIILEDKR